MSVLSLIYLVCSVCSLRTSLIFVLIFAAAAGFALAAAGFGTMAAGMAVATKVLVGAGAAFFSAVMLGW